MLCFLLTPKCRDTAPVVFFGQFEDLLWIVVIKMLVYLKVAKKCCNMKGAYNLYNLQDFYPQYFL